MDNVVSAAAAMMTRKATEVVDGLLRVNKENFESGLYGRFLYEFTDSYFSALRNNEASVIPMTSAAYVTPPDETDQNPPIIFGFTMNLDAISIVDASDRYTSVELPTPTDVLTIVNEPITPEQCQSWYKESLSRGRAANVMVFIESIVKCVGGRIEGNQMVGVPAVMSAVVSTLGVCLADNGSSLAPSMPKVVDGKVTWFYLYTDRLITVTFHNDAVVKALKDFGERHIREREQFKGSDNSFLRILTVNDNESA